MAETAAFVFPTGVGLIGQNGTDRSPLWFAEAVGGPQGQGPQAS